jgi:transposase-like protein
VEHQTPTKTCRTSGANFGQCPNLSIELLDTQLLCVYYLTMGTRNTRTPVDLLDAVRFFADPNVCRDFLAEARWPNGVTCPRFGCGSTKVWFIKTRAIWRCKQCLKQFSVKVGSIFEDSPLGLDKWLPAVWLLTAATKGYSSHRLGKALSVTQKTAWFMLHRIRLAMRAGSFEAPLSGEIEGDTSGIGGNEKKTSQQAPTSRYGKCW